MIRKCAPALLLLLCGGLFAQEFRATLTGIVTDPSGAAIPAATVKATNKATNAVSETQSTGSGVYTIPLLEPGVYNIEATAPGFQTLKRADITLAVGQRLNMAISLTVGQTTTEITVTGQQDVIDTGDANKGLVFDPEKTQSYPLNGRQTYMLLSLTPGVIFTQEQFGASGFSGTRGWDVNSSYKFNGARGGNGNNVFLLNGTPISNEGSTWLFAPSVDAIQEFSAMTTVYDAQYGHQAGGVVNTVVKSGSNAFKGNIYEYFRNARLDANFLQNNAGGVSRGNHQQHQFGGTLGGPIRKDKDFIFLSYEGWQEVIPFPGTGQTVPPMDLRGGENFTKYNMVVADPLTNHACGSSASEPCTGSNGSQWWRNPFPGNVIPKSRISPVATKILSYFPAPTVPGVGAAGISNNFINSANRGRYWYNTPMARWDHNFSQNNKFYALFSEFHGYEYRSTNTFEKPLAQGNIDNNRTTTGLNLNDTHVLSPTAVLDVKLSFMRFTQYNGNFSDQARAITPQAIGMTNLKGVTTDTHIPSISIGGFTSPVFGPTGDALTFQPYNRWTFTPSVNWTRGRHNLRMGFEYGYETRGDSRIGPAYGAFTFGETLTRVAADRASTSGTDGFQGIASLLLGLPTSGTIANNASSYVSRPYYGMFVQDSFKMNSRVTLDFGLRYEIQLAYLERYNRMSSQFDINTVNPLSDQIMARWNTLKAQYNATNPKYPYPDAPPAFYGVWRYAGVDGMPRRTHNTDFSTVAPRVGLAFRLDDKTVLRTGVGVYYQSDTQTFTNNTGFSVSTPYQNSINVNGVPMPRACFPDGTTASAQCTSGAPTGPFSLVNPFPEGLASAPGASAGLLANVGQGSTTNPLHWKTPRTYQYSFGIQRQLPKAMMLDVSYAGNYAQGDRTGTGWDMGSPQDLQGVQNQQIAMQDPAIFNNQVPNPFQGILPTTITSRGANATVSRSSLLNYYTLWNGYTNVDYSERHFRSDALQVKFEKRAFGDGSAAGILTWVVSYTFSKQLFFDCCQGPGWAQNYTAELNLSMNPQGAVVGTLVPKQISSRKELFYTQYDSANKPQQLSISGLWDLPFGKGRRFGAGASPIVEKLIGGWRTDWIFTYISGNAVGLPNAVNFCGDYVNYVDRATGQRTGQTLDHWFNNDPKCYTNFPSNAINTNLPPRFSGHVNNPAKPQLNVSVEKNIAFQERYRLNLRGEAFNVTNTPIRPGPATGFTSATFGIIPNSQNNFPRVVQLAVKLYF